MNVAAAHRRMALAVVLLAIASFAASQRDAWVLVAGGGLAIAAVALTEGPRARTLPSWAVRVGVLTAIAWGGIQFASRPGPEEAAGIVGTVVLVAMLVKLGDRKRARDWRQVAVLAVVLVVSAALASSELPVGALVIAAIAALVPFAMLHQMQAGAEAAADARRAAVPEGSAGLAVDAPQGSRVSRSVRRTAFAGIVIGLAMSVAAFAVFPRDISGSGQGGARVSGFRPDVQLWSGGRISQSSRVAMTVRLLDPRDVAAELTMPLRMRGAVLDRYDPDEARWRERMDRTRWKTFRPAPGGRFEPFAPEVRDERSNVWTQVVQMRSLASDRVFSAWMPLAIASEESRAFALDTRTGEISDYGGSAGRPRGYAIRMQAYPQAKFVQAVLPGSAPAAGRAPSFPVPRIREIAESILRESDLVDLPDEAEASRDPELRRVRDRRIAAYFEAYLSSARFRYTTDLSAFRRVGDEDPIVLFLERYRFGHCELFASAMAALCRSMGIDARLVTGFISTEYDGVADRFVFRESGAHAWVEVRTGDWQWVTFDPSPMEELLAIQQANRTWLDGFRWLLDPVEFAWNSRFAGFDSRSQAEIAERLGAGSRQARDWMGARADDVRALAVRWFMPGAAGFAWLVSAASAAALGMAAMVILLRRSRRIRRQLGAGALGHAERRRLARDARFYLDALDALRRAGLAKPRWRTPLAHAEALDAAAPSAAAAFREIAERLYRLRFAGERPTAADRAAADAAVLRLRAALASGYTR